MNKACGTRNRPVLVSVGLHVLQSAGSESFPEAFPDPLGCEIGSDIVVKTAAEILKGRIEHEIFIKESGLP